MQNKTNFRDVFYISDGTAITAETLAHAVLGQFSLDIKQTTLPFVESIERAKQVKNLINQSNEKYGVQPLVFYSVVVPEIKQIIEQADALFYDVLKVLVEPLERDLAMKATPQLQRSHSINKDSASYHDRIAAIEYTLAHDDGVSLNHLEQADIILLGVSRCGKTPTSLYLAMQFGLRAVNYPFIADDMSALKLPKAIEPYRFKTFGLTIDIERLVAIRNERFADSEYASLEQCQDELHKVEAMFRREAIPYLNTSSLSVEEISTRLLSMSGLKRNMC
ncbi:phosphoenolpyruvate synthase regulatory protein [Photobacterium kishitanii]|uniref:Putative phosphoenolpyruvate synthase regulatory protein n=1 Tax=Photobacterium kishitanii TaxID=318456 RepID=A0AAX0YZC0_9GAMM|nr:pyruvate, water dikinase regulatory protein [Photobacterium kishitanii]KJG11555.1 phosphoenolpyruvate synthase regulatory protein [Photobacterium kishitanii]KJG55455.1 phosphoenolpyruvate synthase regulatory protein [Photobacterium kishitanii]KJG61117.1 phosphoenolpyruvate synthase regulatory protein [Photobacterium kishitanii]KJG65277.1 phosphoenolpyruvate synthase regulatory protein [Photobacterium kishitanii]PSU23164.1 kinase/pyrophosphorylase [Photobacterium kishitanii]